MKRKRVRLKSWMKTAFSFIANPHLLLCWALAWLITNGWSYILLGLGVIFDITWMQAVAGAYITFLWMPVTPEKIITTAIAMFFLKLLYPSDEKTLGVLKDLLKKAKSMLRRNGGSKKQNEEEKDG